MKLSKIVHCDILALEGERRGEQRNQSKKDALSYLDQSYTSQVLSTFQLNWSAQPFGQIKNGLISGRLACTSSKC